MPYLSLLLAMAALMAVTPPAAAQDWPTRPVTMVVPFPAGGPSDVFARILAPRLSELLGQQVIVENVGGAGGMLGVQRVARAAPDGYQFVLGDIGTFAQNQTLYKKPLYNAVTDFAPVMLIAENPMVLVARRDLPADDVPQFIAYAKANQEKMQYGSGGTGSPPHVTCALLNATIGVNVIHIPYRSNVTALQDLVAGRIDYLCNPSVTAIPHIEAKTLKAIAILTKNRSSSLPSLPSAHDQGLIDFDAPAWGAFFLPKGTPGAIIRKLHDATVATLETPWVQRRMRELDGTIVAPDHMSSEYLATFVVSEIKKWAEVIKAANISAN
jgi:tripartite-type tricarboxylate transporter receptor subunit TctC